MNILHFQNPPQKTVFAPVWNYYVCEDNIKHLIDIEKYKQMILKKEKDIILNNSYTHDWGTGLGNNSMTSRSDSFNVLKWSNTENLKKAIRNTFNLFLKNIGLMPDKSIYVQCWANVLRKGEQINQHQHWHSPYTFLGGHICIQANDTNTNYVNPFTKEIYNSHNQFGKITLFPNWLEHYTDKHLCTTERITIAFDIIPQITFDEDIYENKKDHWVRL